MLWILIFSLLHFFKETLKGAIDVHKGGGEGGEAPPRQIFEKLVNKNAIKPKIGGPPWQFFLKPLTPPKDFGKTSSTPPPGFSTHVHLCSELTPLRDL
jgi:hypothetical protein